MNLDYNEYIYLDLFLFNPKILNKEESNKIIDLNKSLYEWEFLDLIHHLFSQSQIFSAEWLISRLDTLFFSDISEPLLHEIVFFRQTNRKKVIDDIKVKYDSYLERILVQQKHYIEYESTKQELSSLNMLIPNIFQNIDYYKNQLNSNDTHVLLKLDCLEGIVSEIVADIENYCYNLLEFYSDQQELTTFLKTHILLEKKDYLSVEEYIALPALLSPEEWQYLILQKLQHKKSIEERFTYKSFIKSCLNRYQSITGVNEVYDCFTNELYHLFMIELWLDTIDLSSNDFDTALNKEILREQISITNKESQNFDLNPNKGILLGLYNQLSKYDFIDISKTSKQDFFNVFELDWDKHESLVHLKMDNPNTNLLFNELETVFQKRISLKILEKSQKIRNNNGLIKHKSIQASASRNRKYSEEPKNSSIIREIIKSIKKVNQLTS